MVRGDTLQQAQRVLDQILDLIYPPRCAACQLTGHVLCPSCLAAIRPLEPPLCYRCGTTLSPQQQCCLQCLSSPLHLNGLRVASIYQEPLRSCILALKYGNNKRLAMPLGELLARAYRFYDIQADLIVPMPLHHTREKERGYNQSRLLAEVCATSLGLPVHPELVTRIRATRSQAELEARERQSNVKGAFFCNAVNTTGRLLERRIIVIDDVCTTGATMEACASALFAAGARVVWGLTLARPCFT